MVLLYKIFLTRIDNSSLLFFLSKADQLTINQFRRKRGDIKATLACILRDMAGYVESCLELLEAKIDGDFPIGKAKPKAICMPILITFLPRLTAQAG